MNRVFELDLTKAFVVAITMIGIHTLYHLSDWNALSSLTSVCVINVLATAWGAPVFMFCMGVTLGFSRNQDAGTWVKRGFYLLTIGMFLNVLRWGPFAFTAYATDEPELMKELALIYNVDILQFAGLAFMLLALCKRLKMGAWGVLVLSLVMNIIGSMLIGYQTKSYVVNQVLGYFYHTSTCSCFTLMNWFVFVAAGNLMSRIYKESDDVDRWFRYIIPICGLIACVHQYLSITGGCSWFKTLENDWEFYNMKTPDALCIAFGVVPFMIGVFRLIRRLIPDSWIGVLSYPSNHITQFFCVSWVWIMWIDCFLCFIDVAKTFGGFLLMYGIICALTTVTVVVYNRYLKDRWTLYIGAHRMYWYLAVWLGLIAFGVWYFANYSEPFAVPY